MAVVADREDHSKFVFGPAGCGKTLATNFLLHELTLLQAECPCFAGWHFLRLDVQYTQTLPQFSKLLFQVLPHFLAGTRGCCCNMLLQ